MIVMVLEQNHTKCKRLHFKAVRFYNQNQLIVDT